MISQIIWGAMWVLIGLMIWELIHDLWVALMESIREAQSSKKRRKKTNE